VKDSKWIKTHAFLCQTYLEDPKYQNVFIEQLGERFDNLRNFQLMQVAQNMATAGLN